MSNSSTWYYDSQGNLIKIEYDSDGNWHEVTAPEYYCSSSWYHAVLPDEIYLPETIDILGIPYTIEIVEKVDDESVGSLEIVTSHIKLENRKPHIQKETLLHELIHCADQVTTDPNKEALIERDVARISSVLFAILRSNPDIVRWMFLNDLPARMENNE